MDEDYVDYMEATIKSLSAGRYQTTHFAIAELVGLQMSSLRRLAFRTTCLEGALGVAQLQAAATFRQVDGETHTRISLKMFRPALDEIVVYSTHNFPLGSRLVNFTQDEMYSLFKGILDLHALQTVLEGKSEYSLEADGVQSLNLFVL